VDVGQIANPGQQAVQIGDQGKLQVETTDLAEVDVAKVAAGQSVNVSVDAFPGKVFNGTVLRVAQAANEKSGKKVFKVVIDLPDTANSGLRWGMTANVEIVIKQ
jgi:HlyD family secretion protein